MYLYEAENLIQISDYVYSMVFASVVLSNVDVKW